VGGGAVGGTSGAGAGGVAGTGGIGATVGGAGGIAAGTGGSRGSDGWDWAVTAGDDFDTNVSVRAAATLPDGSSTYVAGNYYGSAKFGSKTLVSAGKADAFLVKYDSDGAVSWAVSAGGALVDTVTSISALPDGTVFVAGRYTETASFGDITLEKYDHTNTFVARYEADGSLAWAARVGETGEADPSPSVAALPDGSCYVAGSFHYYPTTFGSVSLLPAGNQSKSDIYLAKYAANGAFVAVTQAGGVDAEIATGVAAMADGSALVTGRFEVTASFGSTDLAASGAADAFLVKFRPDRSVAWATKLPGADVDSGYAAAVSGLSDGSSYVVTTDDTQSVLSRVGANGAVAWSVPACNAVSVATSSDGSAFLAGVVSSCSVGSKTLTSSSADFFTARVGSDGGVVWTTQSSGGGSSASPVYVTSSDVGLAHIAGVYWQQATFGSSSLTADTLDFFVAEYATNGGVNWAHAGGFVAGSTLSLSSATTLADGTTYVAGSFTVRATFGSVDIVSAGGTDTFLAKYRADGSLAWVVRGGGAGDDVANSVFAMPDGSVYMTGAFVDAATFGGTTLPGNAVQQLFLVKYEPDGTVAWGLAGGGFYDTMGYSVSALADGSVYVAGTYYASTQFGGTSLNAGGAKYGAFLVKFKPDRSIAWAKGPTTSSAGFGAAAMAVATLADGSAYVTGWQAGDTTFGSVTVSGLGNDNAYVAKYDTNGSVSWVESQGDASHAHRAYSLATLSDGSVYVSGLFSTQIWVGSSLTLLGAYDDVFVAKYDPNGTPLWAANAGSGFYSFRSAVATLADGSVFVTGSDDALLSKYGATGTLLWSTAPGGQGTAGHAVTALADGTAYVAGRLENTTAFGGVTFTSLVGDDAFVARHSP
jgi:hypothetical protein